MSDEKWQMSVSEEQFQVLLAKEREKWKEKEGDIFTDHDYDTGTETNYRYNGKEWVKIDILELEV